MRALRAGRRRARRRRSPRASPAAPTCTRRSGRLPINSVNFITCHDGFTLNDLVSYNEKHNEANGEDNRDGDDDNLSWNCGVEGPTDDPAIEALRERQIKNFAAILLLSQGVPMFLAGDEVRRTQQRQQQRLLPGQRAQLVRLDAGRAERRTCFRFFKQMIAFRKRHREPAPPRVLHRRRTTRAACRTSRWHGLELDQPAGTTPASRVLAFTLGGRGAPSPTST